MADYAQLPAGATLSVRPFKAHVDDGKLDYFKKLLDLSPIAPAVFENTHAGWRYGMTREWLENAKKVWLNDFDWRKQEDRINSFPNFKASVEDEEGNAFDIQFLALFSKKPDAIPVAFFHGWPGSVCEFLDILDILKSRYSPEDLPYHVIVPSLPGYAYSSGPPLDRDYGVEMAADALHKLMVGLGFGDGYLAQGGDLGSFVSRILAMKYDGCKGMHVNMMGIPPYEDAELTKDEKYVLERAAKFMDRDCAFVLEHGTKTATIGFTLSASPLALLSWIGEKFLQWMEEPSLEKILEAVTLYWLTDTFPRCLYHNRGMGDPEESPRIASASAVRLKFAGMLHGLTGLQVTKLSPLKLPYVEKPCGYSLFAHEIIPVPKSWAAQSCNLISFNQHEHGGHFAALERPSELLTDVEEYIQKAWK